MAFTFLEVWHCLDCLFFVPKVPPSLLPEGEQVKAWLQWNKMMARISNTTSSRTLDFGIKLSTSTLWNCVKIELKRIVKFSAFSTPGYRDWSYYKTLAKMGAEGDEAIKKAAKGDDYAWLRAGYGSGSDSDDDWPVAQADRNRYLGCFHHESQDESSATNSDA